MTRRKIDVTVIVPLILLALIVTYFIIASNGKLVTPANLQTILDQTIIVITVGLGVIFVVATGGTDLSVGTTIGLSTVFASIVSKAAGSELVLFPVALVIAFMIGALNGFLVVKLRVPSFMATLAMLIGIRGIVNFLISSPSGLYRAGPILRMFGNLYVKLSVLIILIILAYFLLHHTKFGKYCRAIGENEMVAICVGVPVAKVKFLAFIISSLMAAIGGFFTIAKVGGTNTSMGSGVEIDVIMAIFLGSVLVTGGYSTKIQKLVIGAFTLSVVKNGMIMAGMSSIRDTQTAQGLLLMLILLLTMQISNRSFSFFRKSDSSRQKSDK